jgi:ABC-type transport system involved in multi-copper enzyme maturation permease subunit
VTLFETGKLLHSKILMVFSAFMVLIPVLLVVFCGILSDSGAAFIKKDCSSLVSQCDEIIPELEEEIKKFSDDSATTARLEKIIASYQKSREANADMVAALESGDKYKYLDASIREYENDLSGLNSGFVQGVSRTELQNQLTFYKYLQDNSIQPLVTSYDVNFVNMFTLFTAYIYPLLFPVFIILLSASFSTEYRNHTMKFLCQQPYKRSRIFVSKYLSVNFILLLVSAICFAVLFAVSYAIGGSGSFLYPVEKISTAAADTQFVTAGTFITHAGILFIVNTVFISSIGLLLSLLIKSGIICAFVCATIAFIPTVIKSQYTDITNIILSNFYIAYVAAALVMTIIFLMIGISVFRKKNIFA